MKPVLRNARFQSRMLPVLVPFSGRIKLEPGPFLTVMPRTHSIAVPPDWSISSFMDKNRYTWVSPGTNSVRAIFFVGLSERMITNGSISLCSSFWLNTHSLYAVTVNVIRFSLHHSQAWTPGSLFFLSNHSFRCYWGYINVKFISGDKLKSGYNRRLTPPLSTKTLEA